MWKGLRECLQFKHTVAECGSHQCYDSLLAPPVSETHVFYVDIQHSFQHIYIWFWQSTECTWKVSWEFSCTSFCQNFYFELWCHKFKFLLYEHWKNVYYDIWIKKTKGHLTRKMIIVATHYVECRELIWTTQRANRNNQKKVNRNVGRSLNIHKLNKKKKWPVNKWKTVQPKK